MSTTSDAGQQTLLQSFASPASRAVAVSLSDKEAVLSADGKSKDDAIWIASDEDSDTEDEGDDEGQDLDDSQSCTTPTTSIADHLDSTGAKHSPTESEASIGIDTTPAVSPARAEDDPIWTQDPLADPEPNQQSPCQTNRTSTGDSTAYIDASFDVLPTNPESQPCLSVSDEQQLVTEATGDTSEPGIMTIDGLPNEGSCHGAQSAHISPSIRTCSPTAVTPEEMAHTLLHDSEVCASTSRNDAIPGTHTPSPAGRLSPASQQEQDFDHTSCGSSDAESKSSEAESGSPFGARVSPPSPELAARRRSRRRPSHAHETVQDKDSDVDTEGSGSEDGLGVPKCVRDEDYCPSPPKVQGSGSEDDDFDYEHRDRKRRKVYRSPSPSIRNATSSGRVSRRSRRSTRAVSHSLTNRDTSALDVLSPTPSHARSVPSDASTFFARFQEWPLENVSMKRITENGKTTFQFQFEWPLCTNYSHATSVIPDSTRSVSMKKTTKRAPARRSKYSNDEDNFLIQLKEEEQLGWAEIRRRFAQRFPERGGSGLQVHYCTKLKDCGRT
ncbi:hypothetical protein AU210_014674 [Fusarium oxysporum f. sp. radicis-cucumerinum]|uniref:Myb-like domain-containing protein n=1 Tax=Fusarium oxysporum f. sp. radicis-cucumerinum TaxID=327505 RepID=A0A2H3FV30_FUSOX|nr:hypothetical protein AU210_014674 [Fusarium oxysporum f. sp. radicis-cucumerinum]